MKRYIYNIKTRTFSTEESWYALLVWDKSNPENCKVGAVSRGTDIGSARDGADGWAQKHLTEDQDYKVVKL